MGYGLIDAGNSTKASGVAGMDAAAGLANQREMFNRQMSAAEQAAKMQTMGTLAGAGLQYGMSSAGAAIGGPMGALIGAGLGLLVGELF